MANFQEAIEKTLAHEGGYVNDPDDAGGETNFGISKRSFPAEDIKNMTIERAKEIYRVNYWNPVKGDQIENQQVAESIFDFAVNAGTVPAIVLAQRVVDVEDDGKIGPVTIQEINKFNASHFLAAYTVEKVRRYTEIVKRHPKKIKYYLGWIDRALN